MIRAITFDAGETLVFDRPTRDERVASALDTSGIPYTAVELVQAIHAAQAYGMARYLLGKSIDDPLVMRELLRIILEGIGATGDNLTIQTVAESYGAIRFERYLDPAVIPLLEQLRGRGFKIGVISDWEPDLPELLKMLGCRHLLDSVSVSSIVGVTKPNPKLFRDALDKLGVLPDEALHIGDYLELDVAGAQSAGMSAVLYDWRGWHDDAAVDVPVVRSFPVLTMLLAALPAP